MEVVVENDDFCGNVTINSITPKMTDGRWSGKYYADYPAEISVKSQNGKQFACFELSDGRKYYDDSVTIELSEDVTISVKYK